MQNLWRASARGLDGDGRIMAALEAAASDSNPEVVELARQAVADLKRFRERQSQAAFPQSTPPPRQHDMANTDGGMAGQP